jgi:hypothetical protein
LSRKRRQPAYAAVVSIDDFKAVANHFTTCRSINCVFASDRQPWNMACHRLPLPRALDAKQTDGMSNVADLQHLIE